MKGGRRWRREWWRDLTSPHSLPLSLTLTLPAPHPLLHLLRLLLPLLAVHTTQPQPCRALVVYLCMSLLNPPLPLTSSLAANWWEERVWEGIRRQRCGGRRRVGLPHTQGSGICSANGFGVEEEFAGWGRSVGGSGTWREGSGGWWGNRLLSQPDHCVDAGFFCLWTIDVWRPANARDELLFST